MRVSASIWRSSAPGAPLLRSAARESSDRARPPPRVAWVSRPMSVHPAVAVPPRVGRPVPRSARTARDQQAPTPAAPAATSRRTPPSVRPLADTPSVVHNLSDLRSISGTAQSAAFHIAPTLSASFAQLSLQTLHSVHDFPLFRPVGKVDHGSHGFHGWGTPESVPIREIRGSSFCPFGCGGATLGSSRLTLPCPSAFRWLAPCSSVRSVQPRPLAP